MAFSPLARAARGQRRVEGKAEQRRGGADLAIDETVTLLHPPSTFSRCINRDEEGVSAK